MFNRKVELSNLGLKILTTVAIFCFFSIPAVTSIGASQGLHLSNEERQVFSQLQDYFLPIGAMAFGVLVSQYLPVWNEKHSQS